jgi:hypothetical protein
MKNKKLSALAAILLIIICPFPLSASSAGSLGNADAKWSYSVSQGTEKSKRDYLLVYEPGKQQEKKINVISTCTKPYPAEGVYGKCTHDVSFQPSNTTFKLNSGEDVVIIQFTWDAPLILATIEYGCCAGADIVRFYTDKGKYLGSIWGYSVSNRANYNNVIARTFNMGNGARYREKIYLLVQKDEGHTDLQAVVFNSNKWEGMIPVSLSIPSKDICGDWSIDEFYAYGDDAHRKDITLKLKGSFCDTSETLTEKIFSCTASETQISCQPSTTPHTSHRQQEDTPDPKAVR